MKAGPLRDRATIERQVETTQVGGLISISWEPYLEDISCAIEYTGRWRETLQATQIAAESDCRIRIRWRQGITEKMRVKHQIVPGSPTLAEYFDIQGVLPADQRKVELHLYCIKRAAEGFRTGAPT